jgi:hypothetical protein
VTLADYSSAFRQCLLDVDIATMRKLWKHVAPHLPQPGPDSDVEISIHHARTVAKSIGFKARAYSHSWLSERGLPSGLPDDMRPAAERLYPRITPAVGLSVNFRSLELQPIKPIVHDAMRDAILEVHADGKIEDSPLVKQRMAEARRLVFKQLMLSVRRP